MAWLYVQSTGQLFDGTGALIGVGYAGGNLGKNPEGVNNPEAQSERMIGPLPQGWYTIEDAINHPRLGPVSMPLIPDVDNQMFQRGGFYLHANLVSGGQRASEGCIVMDRPIRDEVAASEDRRLQVVAVKP